MNANHQRFWAVVAIGVGVIVVVAIFDLSPVPSPLVPVTVSQVGSHGWVIGSGLIVTTAPFGAPPNSTVYVFIGYANSEIGGGNLLAVSDSSDDAFQFLVSTAFSENYTETLYESVEVAGNSQLNVSATFAPGLSGQSASVAVVDVVHPSAVSLSTGEGSGVGPLASVVIAGRNSPGSQELMILGVSGQAQDAPVQPDPGESLLDTGFGLTGALGDGEGFGTVAETGAPSQIGAPGVSLNASAVWNAIGVGLISLSPQASALNTAFSAPNEPNVQVPVRIGTS